MNDLKSLSWVSVGLDLSIQIVNKVVILDNGRLV